MFSKRKRGSWNDGLQWLIEISLAKRERNVDRMVGEVMGIWYNSVHILSITITYALLNLYTRPYTRPKYICKLYWKSHMENLRTCQF
jgi:hypothetical protein